MASIIYVLTDPRTQEIRYVGGTISSIKRRLSNHISNAKYIKHKYYSARWIRTLLKQNLQPQITIVQHISIDEYFECEKYWIAWFRSIGTRLTNSTDGGEGTLGYKPSYEQKEKRSQSRLGYKFSEETKLKMSESAKVKPPFTEEHRKNISIGHKGQIAWNKGKKTSDETKLKQSLAKLGKKLSEEHKKNVSIGLQGHLVSEEIRQKIRVAQPNYKGRL